MRPGATLGDQLVAYATRERQVGDAVAVKMTELPSADAELDPAESVRRGLHAGP